MYSWNRKSNSRIVVHYEVVNSLLTALNDKGKGLDYRLDDIIEFVESNPDILQINANIRQRQTPLEVDVSLNWLEIR